MHRKAIVHSAFLALALFSACPGSETAKPTSGDGPAPAVKGLVLVTVEGWWDPAAAADPFTAASLPGAIRLDDALTPCPQPRPAVVSILTGQTPDRHGVRDDLARPLPAETPYLPELLAKAGWQTAAFITNPHVGIGSGLERGFATFDAPRDFVFGPFRFQPRLRNAEDAIANFATWTQGVDPGRPYFAWVHLAFGGPATKELPTEVPGARGGAVSAAWTRLASLLSENERLRGASVIVSGTEGKVDRSKGETSGYFLDPSILRIPALYRGPGGTTTGVDPARPLAASDLAALAAEDAGLASTFPDALSPRAPSDRSRMRFAWIWRGSRDFNWPVQGGVVRGDAFLVSEGEGTAPTVSSWSGGTTPAGESVAGLAEALAARPTWTEPRTPVAPPVPEELRAALAKVGVSIPAAATLPPAPSMATRIEQLGVMFEARALAQRAEAVAAMEAFDRAAAMDPASSGARVEAGQLLTLVGRHKKARERLEAHLRAHPFDAEGWHWLGHTALGLQEPAKADAVLQLANLLNPHNADVLYDLACAKSLLEDVAGAETYLRKAWAAGYRDTAHIEGDGDLRNLRADPRYARFMQEVVR